MEDLPLRRWVVLRAWGIVGGVILVLALTGTSQVCAAVPDIKANGVDGPLALRSEDALSITLALDPQSARGQAADW